jgi:hypothetical protein
VQITCGAWCEVAFRRVSGEAHKNGLQHVFGVRRTAGDAVSSAINLIVMLLEQGIEFFQPAAMGNGFQLGRCSWHIVLLHFPVSTHKTLLHGVY